jgi:hypothetical protein
VELHPKVAKKGEWTEMILDFSSLKKGTTVRRIDFFLPPETRFWLDDLLLYERGKREK